MADKTLPNSIDSTLDLLAKADYIADRSLATVLYLALMGRPLFVEGEAEVGKTEIAKVLSQTLGRRLIRLQCYEGLDVSSAVYEWNYGAQMIAIRLAEAEGEGDRSRIEHDVFSERFLIKRPLLQALEPGPAGRPGSLDRRNRSHRRGLRAFLLEVLADFQLTVPESGMSRRPAADRRRYLQPHTRSARRTQTQMPTLRLECFRLSDRANPHALSVVNCQLAFRDTWASLVQEHSVSGKGEFPGETVGIVNHVFRNQHRLTCGLLVAGVKGLRHKVPPRRNTKYPGDM